MTVTGHKKELSCDWSLWSGHRGNLFSWVWGIGSFLFTFGLGASLWAQDPQQPPADQTNTSQTLVRTDEEILRDEFPPRPTKYEINQIRETVDLAFRQFLQLWEEERYFELYDWGRKQSRDFISPEEFATRMVKLDWLPDSNADKPPHVVSYRFRTLIYVDATIPFRHKTDKSLKFSKRQTFLLLWEDKRWRFDLLQMLRSPFYTPFDQKE